MTHFGTYRYKHSLCDDEPWKEVHLLKSDPPAVIPTLNVLPCRKVPIKPAKHSDIQKQMKYIPPIYHGFYKGLTTSSVADDSRANVSINNVKV